MIHSDFKDAKVEEFSSLAVGEEFWFATREKSGQRPYTKEEEQRRPYTPESHSNSSFLWKNIDQHGTILAEGKTFFYTSPCTKVVRK